MLPPLVIAEADASARAGVAGRAVTAARRAVVRLLTPTLADLLTQLERDRHRQHAEVERLRMRVARLEADLAAGGAGGGRGAGAEAPGGTRPAG